MAGITSNNVANAIVKLVAADALPTLVGNLVMGNLVNRDYERAWLPSTLQPGTDARVPITITAPATPGRYALKFDLVSEGIDWFEACGSPTTTKTLVVI